LIDREIDATLNPEDAAVLHVHQQQKLRERRRRRACRWKVAVPSCS
jgi:hypothetical protein